MEDTGICTVDYSHPASLLPPPPYSAWGKSSNLSTCSVTPRNATNIPYRHWTTHLASEQTAMYRHRLRPILTQMHRVQPLITTQSRWTTSRCMSLHNFDARRSLSSTTCSQKHILRLVRHQLGESLPPPATRASLPAILSNAGARRDQLNA